MRWHFFIKILLVLLLVISLNQLASKHYLHRDFSRSHRFSLSEQGSVLFSKIQRPAHMIIYFSPNSSTLGAELFEDIEALMQEYQIKGRENLIIEYLNPIKNLGRARELQQHYHFNASENLIIIDYMDHTKIIPFKELGDYDYPSTTAETAPRLLSFRGEQVINAALIELSQIPLKKIYFLQGHGEKIPGTPPLEVIGRYLQHQYMEIQPLNLALTQQQVPEDASLIMILGASYDLSQEEATVLKNYWLHAGRLFILLDPVANTPNLLQVIQTAGISPHGDRILSAAPTPKDHATSQTTIGLFTPGCELTKQFLALNIVFAGPTESLDLTAPLQATENSDALTLPKLQRRALIETAPGFWGGLTEEQASETTFSSLEENTTTPPLTIAAMADFGALHDDRMAVSAARMIVVGNSDFIHDKNINSLNLDFFSSALNGLIDRIALTGNTAKMKDYFTLNLHEEEMQQIIFWSMVVIPLLGAFIGLTIFWRRRS